MSMMAASLLVLGLTDAAAQAQWLQWGGPDRNFVVDSSAPLADSWPDDGPPQLWKRKLGKGYSGIVADGDRIYTMYSRGTTERVVCIDVATGETVWERKYKTRFKPREFDLSKRYGPGVKSTPLIVDDRIFTMGINAIMHCLDKKTGAVLWRHDLINAMGAKSIFGVYGYSSSPAAYRDSVIVPVGGSGQSIVAFDQATGNVLWKSGNEKFTHASPMIIRVADQDQLVCFMAKRVLGLDPANGKLLWEHDYPTNKAGNFATPIFDGKDTLFVSAAYGMGSRGLRLNSTSGAFRVDQLWHSQKMKLHFGSAVLVGDHVYGSSGSANSPCFLTAIDIHTGTVAWKERGFAMASCLYADGKLILLDEDGTLALATVSPAGIDVHAKFTAATHPAWTTPTLAGTKLLVRDQKTIAAYELAR